MVEYLRKKKLLDSQVNQNEKCDVVDAYCEDLTDVEVCECSVSVDFVCVVTQD